LFLIILADVNYYAPGFIAKNKDTLFDDLVLMLQSSPHRFSTDHGWNDIVVQSGQKRRPPTVGKIFKQQVEDLMGALSACFPHYIRWYVYGCLSVFSLKCSGTESWFPFTNVNIEDFVCFVCLS